MARRCHWAIVVVPLLVVVLTAQQEEPNARRQTGAIAGIHVLEQPSLVFDHVTDKREPNHLPDLSVTAWKEADGTVNLLVPHFENYRMRGPDLEHLTSVPDTIFSSAASASEPVEAQYNYRQWLAAPYTFDGRTIYALGHHEWHACLIAGDCGAGTRRSPTSTGNYYLNSWANAVTSLVSVDGGASWQVNGANRAHLVSSERFTWSGSPALADGIYRRALNHSGMMSPSRIIREGDYYYSIAFLVHRDFSRIDPVTSQAPSDKGGWVLMRTTDPTRASGWEGWVSGDRYVGLNSHAFTAFSPMTDAGQPQIIYDTNARTYVAIFVPYSTLGPVYYVTTPSLASPVWSKPMAVAGTADLPINPRDDEAPASCSIGFQTGNYVSLIDTHSGGLNFEFTDGDPWLFYSYNPALGCGGNNLDRDIVRVRLRIDYE